MRKRRAVKRDVLPDPIFNSKVVTKLINQIMKDGKKGTAESILKKAAAFATVGILAGLLANKSRGAWLTELIVVREQEFNTPSSCCDCLC